MSEANLNGIDVAALQGFANTVRENPQEGMSRFFVKTDWKGQTKTVATVSQYELGGKSYERKFEIATDEPLELLGQNNAPNPQEILMAALNACMSVGYAANAAVMGIKLDALSIETTGALDLRGFLGLDDSVKPGFEDVEFTVRIKTTASQEKVNELHATVMRTSPNFSNFASAIKMVPNLVIE